MNIKAIFQSTTLAVALSTASFALPDRAEAGTEPFIGEMMIVGFNFCPRGWIEAAGQILPINANQALFSLYGTNFGGDGRVTFAVPDMRGRTAIGEGSGAGLQSARLGAKTGSGTVVMNQTTMPTHNHMVNVTNEDGDKPGPGGKLLAAAPTGGTGNETIYSEEAANRQMSSQMIGTTGGQQQFSVADPTLALVHCIATQGIFPPRN